MYIKYKMDIYIYIYNKQVQNGMTIDKKKSNKNHKRKAENAR